MAYRPQGNDRRCCSYSCSPRESAAHQLNPISKPSEERGHQIDRAVGGRLRRARALAGVELGDLANALGVSMKIAEELETGRQRLDPSFVAKAVTFLGVSVEYLFREDDGPEILPSSRPLRRY
jgi:ribosome-binding protein aMBF1 (putative translation factor)